MVNNSFSNTFFWPQVPQPRAGLPPHSAPAPPAQPPPFNPHLPTCSSDGVKAQTGLIPCHKAPGSSRGCSEPPLQAQPGPTGTYSRCPPPRAAQPRPRLLYLTLSFSARRSSESLCSTWKIVLASSSLKKLRSGPRQAALMAPLTPGRGAAPAPWQRGATAAWPSQGTTAPGRRPPPPPPLPSGGRPRFPLEAERGGERRRGSPRASPGPIKPTPRGSGGAPRVRPGGCGVCSPWGEVVEMHSPLS